MIISSLARLLAEEKSMKRLAVTVNVLLGLLLSYQLAVLIGGRAEEHAIALPDGGLNLAQPSAPQSEKVPLMSLEQVHLFGEPPITKRQNTEAKAPEVRPPLSLRGIVHSTNPRAARAIIAEVNGRDVAYPLGARLAGGMRLTKINYRNVVLLHRGREQVLQLSNKVAPGN